MIIGERVRLRAIEREDIPTFVRWFNDPEFRNYLQAFEPMSKAKEERWFEGRLNATNDFMFAIEALDDDKWVHIGNLGLHRVDWKNGFSVFGIGLGERAYWNRGYGTEATRLILSFAFNELNLHRVELEVFDFNARARRAYEKAGSKWEGTRRQAHYHNGGYHDVHIMGVLKEEFTGSPVAGS